MQERPRRRRFRSRRSRPQTRPAEAAPQRGQRPSEPRPDRRPARPVDQRRERGRDRRPARDELRAGTPCVILLDCREGEPDRTGAAATFEGFFDLESGEARRAASGVPRLRVDDERMWGFECWWRVDPTRAGLTADDREQLETSKRLLRGLLRDARRGGPRGLTART